jgi:hypothetical protein
VKREKARKTINCYYPDIQDVFTCETFTHFFSPLFNRFSTFDKNVNLLKANPEAKNFLLAFPSLNTSIFFSTDLNSEQIKTFREAQLKVTLPNSKA